MKTNDNEDLRKEYLFCAKLLKHCGNQHESFSKPTGRQQPKGFMSAHEGIDVYLLITVGCQGWIHGLSIDTRILFTSRLNEIVTLL